MGIIPEGRQKPDPEASAQQENRGCRDTDHEQHAQNVFIPRDPRLRRVQTRTQHKRPRRCFRSDRRFNNGRAENRRHRTCPFFGFLNRRGDRDGRSAHIRRRRRGRRSLRCSRKRSDVRCRRSCNDDSRTRRNSRHRHCLRHFQLPAPLFLLTFHAERASRRHRETARITLPQTP